MVGGSAGRVVARLAADGTVYTTKNALALKNYKIQTEGDIAKRKIGNVSSVTTTVVDLGKQLLQYARDNNIEAVKALIARGAPFSHDWLGMSALHFAAMNNQYEICEILLNGGINKDAKTKVDRTPLHLACFYGNEKIVELLLSKGCQVNAMDMLRMTPLHWAVEKLFKSIVRLLLKYNADVTVVSKFGKTPIALAVLTEQADILEELQKVRNVQINRKMNEEREKETSEAVNSIMNLCEGVADSDLNTNFVNTNDVNMNDAYNYSTINLLESHGISMLPANDEESRELLNSALNNGRQLILSEGGKLLLNETKLFNTNMNLNNMMNNNNSLKQYNNNSENSNICMQSQSIPSTIASNNIASLQNDKNRINNSSNNMFVRKHNTQKILTSSLAPVASNLRRNKNIRIISLNDFKKIYGNTNVKAVSGFTSSTVNATEMSRNAQIVKVETKDESFRNIAQSADSNDASISNRVETTKIETSFKRSSTSSVRFYPAKLTNMNQQSNVKMAVLSTPTSIQANSNSTTHTSNVPPLLNTTSMNSPALRLANNDANTNSSSPSNFSSSGTPSSTNNIKNIKSNVIPLLTTSQICRQLLELRKQNEELRRKFELAQKQKDDLRLRLERLEELLFLEKTDVFTT